MALCYPIRIVHCKTIMTKLHAMVIVIVIAKVDAKINSVKVIVKFIDD